MILAIVRKSRTLALAALVSALLSACGGGNPPAWMSQTLSTLRQQTLGSGARVEVVIEPRQAAAEALRALGLAGVMPSGTRCAQPLPNGLTTAEIIVPEVVLLVEVDASAVEAAQAAGYLPAQALGRYEGLGPCETFPSPLPVGPVEPSFVLLPTH